MCGPGGGEACRGDPALKHGPLLLFGKKGCRRGRWESALASLKVTHRFLVRGRMHGGQKGTVSPGVAIYCCFFRAKRWQGSGQESALIFPGVTHGALVRGKRAVDKGCSPGQYGPAGAPEENEVPLPAARRCRKAQESRAAGGPQNGTAAAAPFFPVLFFCTDAGDRPGDRGDVPRQRPIGGTCAPLRASCGRPLSTVCG